MYPKSFTSTNSETPHLLRDRDLDPGMSFSPAAPRLPREVWGSKESQKPGNQATQCGNTVDFLTPTISAMTTPATTDARTPQTVG